MSKNNGVPSKKNGVMNKNNGVERVNLLFFKFFFNFFDIANNKCTTTEVRNFLFWSFLTVRIDHQSITLYIPPDKHINKDLFLYFERNFKNYAILGDLNAKIPELNRDFNAKGKVLDEIIRNSKIYILNSNKDPTNFHIRNDIKSTSVIDYFIGTDLFQKNFIWYKVLKSDLLKVYEQANYHRPIMANFNFMVKERKRPKNLFNYYKYE